MFEYFGLLAVVLSWIIGVFIVIRWHATMHKSISEHIAGNRVAYLLGVLVLCGIGPLFYIWVMTYMVPKLQLGPVFAGLLTAVTILQCITGIIPDDGRTWRSRVHRGLAYAWAFLFIPLVCLILASQHISLAGRVAGVMTLGYFAVSSLLFWFVPRSKENYLIFQALYIVAFQLLILIAVYTS